MKSEIYFEENRFEYWWISLLVGLLSLVAGVYCFVTPIESLAVMSVFFVSLLFVWGVFHVVFAVMNRKRSNGWGWSLASGIVELLLGGWLLMLPLPMITGTLVYAIGFWMLFQSVISICEACELSRFAMSGWGWMLACGILSLLCSFLFLSSPIYGGIFVLLYIGFSFIFYGVFRIVVAFKQRKYNKRGTADNA